MSRFPENHIFPILYYIYDKIYDYNYFYNLEEIKKRAVVKEDIPHYNMLKDIFKI